MTNSTEADTVSAGGKCKYQTAALVFLESSVRAGNVDVEALHCGANPADNLGGPQFVA